MAFLQDFDIVRPEPDTRSLFNTLKALDASAGLDHTRGTTRYTIKKNTAWTAPQINAATNAITNAPNASPQLSAQAEVDDYPIVMRALVLTLIDEINILRTQLALPPRTPAQAIVAIRNKAATL